MAFPPLSLKTLIQRRNARENSDTSGFYTPCGSTREICKARITILQEQPDILIIHDYLPEADMPNLYFSVDCLVAPSRGEGWGRPHIEAMAMG